MDGTPVVLGGIIASLQERVIRSGRNEGKRMARFRIEDFHGSVEAVMFSEAFQRHRDQIEENRVLFFRGDVDASREEVCVRVNEVFEPEAAPRALAGLVLLHLDRTDADHLRAVRESLERHSGDRPVLLSVEPQKGLRVLMRADAAFGVDPSPAFVQELRDLVGPERIQLMPPPGGPTARKRNAYRGSSKPQA